jgi:FHS family L-fucose permease-like MFS transporter
MAILGGALFPPLLGVIAHKTGSLALGYLLPAAGYVVVALYAFMVPKLTREVGPDAVNAVPQNI